MATTINPLDVLKAEIDKTNNQNRKAKLQRLHDYIEWQAQRTGVSIFERNCCDAVNEENIDLHPFLVELWERGLLEMQ